MIKNPYHVPYKPQMEPAQVLHRMQNLKEDKKKISEHITLEPG